jgi:hypothetical protein
MLEVDEARLGQYLKDGYSQYSQLLGYYGDGSGAAPSSSRGVQVRANDPDWGDGVGSGRDRMIGPVAFAV